METKKSSRWGGRDYGELENRDNRVWHNEKKKLYHGKNCFTKVNCPTTYRNKVVKVIKNRFDAFHVHSFRRSVNLYVTRTLNVDMSREFISAVSYWTVTWRVIKLWINMRELYFQLFPFCFKFCCRRARRIRFLLTYNYLDLGTKESAAVSLINRRRQRHRQRRARRQAWVYVEHRDGLKKCLGHFDIGYKFLLLIFW